MIYLDNAATGGFKPYGVRDAVRSAVNFLNANPARSGHKLAAAGAQAVFRTRKLAAGFFGCGEVERTVFTKNCTEALNTAIFGLLGEGDHVVITCAEHNSVLRPLAALKEAGKVDFDVAYPQKAAYFAQNRHVSFEDIEPLLKKNTRLVITNHASNVTGSVADVKDIGEKLKKARPEIIYLVDGAQSGGHIDINMARDNIDVLCLAAHKGLLGIMGLGLLLFSERADIRPLSFGGTGGDTFSPQPGYYPERLESGTLNLPAIAALTEGLVHLSAHFTEMNEVVFSLTRTLSEGLESIRGVKVYSRPNPVGIVSFSVDGISSQTAEGRLSDEFGIACRGGFHCAPLMHEFLGTDDLGLARFSLSAFNTEREILAAIAAVKEIAKG